MNVKFGEFSELVLFEHKLGEFYVDLTEQELNEYRIVEKMFNDWQFKLKLRAKDKYERPVYSNKKAVVRD